ncbi:AGAP012010-PA-like protein [Anopheles sinensis]|uniref:AGAP012010-PA-like protein n=1 Tax=Anopheles sinensis TaxID=74873 RepID=A0A084W4H8_ANOSI|nr:AGAP012010-PA-like protein [Anopheles sinensis]
MGLPRAGGLLGGGSRYLPISRTQSSSSNANAPYRVGDITGEFILLQVPGELDPKFWGKPNPNPVEKKSK